MLREISGWVAGGGMRAVSWKNGPCDLAILVAFRVEFLFAFVEFQCHLGTGFLVSCMHLHHDCVHRVDFVLL